MGEMVSNIPSGYMRPGEASRMTGVPVMAIYKRVSRGTIPYVKLPKNKVYVDISEIEVVDRENYITITEAAEKYGVSKARVRKLVENGEIPHVKRFGGKKQVFIPTDFKPKFLRTGFEEYRVLPDKNRVSCAISIGVWSRLNEYVRKNGETKQDVVESALDAFLKDMGY